jgi:hypothetical protein
MKNIILLTIIFASFSAMADSVKYSKEDAGKEIIIAQVENQDKIEIKNNFKYFIDNELEVIVNGNKAYSLNIQGTNSWDRNLLRNAKIDLEQNLLSTKCEENQKKTIVGILVLHEANLINDQEVVIVHPNSLTVVCK